jgi:fructokinase
MGYPYVIVGLGELLWDMLPTGRQIGGAPANFAYWAAQLGNAGLVASRVGADALGDEALALLAERDIPTNFIQRDETHPTSTVEVAIDAAGIASYTIVENVAWDYLEWTEGWLYLAERANAICFGTLAQRAPQARATIREVLRSASPETVRVLDVNFRPPFDTLDVLVESLALADVVKLNDGELAQVAGMLGFAHDDQIGRAFDLLRAYQLDLVCVTRGAHGSLLVRGNEANEHPGFTVAVADTVGAGDSFTAALIHHYLHKADLATMNAAANRLGTWVASQVGGMPAPNQELLLEIK